MTSYQHSYPGDDLIVHHLNEDEELELLNGHRHRQQRTTLMYLLPFVALVVWIAIVLPHYDSASHSYYSLLSKQQKHLVANQLTMSHHHQQQHQNRNRDDNNNDNNEYDWHHWLPGDDDDDDRNGKMPDWNDERGRYNWQKCKESHDPNCWKEEGERVHSFWEDFGKRMHDFWQDFGRRMKCFFRPGGCPTEEVEEEPEASSTSIEGDRVDDRNAETDDRDNRRDDDDALADNSKGQATEETKGGEEEPAPAEQTAAPTETVVAETTASTTEVILDDDLVDESTSNSTAAISLIDGDVGDD